jgi:hypothetical protein
MSTHVHQFDQAFSTAFHTLKALPKHKGNSLGYVCHFSCGNGLWLAAAQALGASRVLGIEAKRQDSEPENIPSQFIAPYDLSAVRVSLPMRSDLAICIDFAHTLPPERTDDFIEDLCKSSDRVLFGAPAQFQMKSTGLNLQWPSYWAKRFAKFGYHPESRFRMSVWGNRLIDPSVRQNCLLYVRRAGGYKFPYALESLDVVHPAIHAELSRRQDWFAKQLTKSTLNRILRTQKP